MPADLRSVLQASIGNSYTIERELGGGGMARVFLATERALGRRVVMKILPPELAAEVSGKRFDREIRLAASLQQANIVPVLSTGSVDGLPYYVMPFVEGLSLRARLERDGGPSLADTVGILRDVARALSYAHERGVVHRDIKPENILLSGHAAIVTDFGIAKAIASARLAGPTEMDSAPRGHSTITQLGVSVGTPPYMAPEQISGDPDIDHRADLYAFGCLAYELITGAPPFRAANVHGLFAAHIGSTPDPIVDRNPEVPASLAAVVMRCLEKDPARRPQSARELLQELESTVPPSSLVRLLRRFSRRQRLAAAAALALGVVSVLGVAGRSLLVADPVPAVAVIPFLNLSGDAADDYLADGIAEGLATALGKVTGIRVASRTLGYRYRGRRDLDANAIGRELSVTHVLIGSVRRGGGRLRVSAQLVDTDENREIWSNAYDRDAGDAFAVQDEITRLVASALPRRLVGGAAGALPATASSGTSDAEAYDLYLRGRYLLQRRGAGVRQSIDYLTRAIARDGNFARAHAAYALALELLPYFETVNVDSLNTLAMAAAHRALAADSSIAEAHTALGLAYQHRYQWAAADSAYRRAVVAEPPDADAQIQYGRFLFYTRTVREALPYFERARELDPTSAVASTWVGHVLDLSGRLDEALVHLRRAMDIDSTNPPSLVFMAQAHLYAGQRDSARFYAERLARVWPGWSGPAAETFAALGDTTAATRLVRAANLRTAEFAGVRAAMGDSSYWFAVKERQTAERQIWPTYMSLSERHLDYMRGSARFAAIVRSVGLDERIFTAPRGGRP